MAIVISTYILINVLEKSSENAERKKYVPYVTGRFRPMIEPWIFQP